MCVMQERIGCSLEGRNQSESIKCPDEIHQALLFNDQFGNFASEITETRVKTHNTDKRLITRAIVKSDVLVVSIEFPVSLQRRSTAS